MQYLLDIASQIIRQSNREHPADAGLRETFKRLRVLNAEETRQITEAVFAYYRWRGWLSDDEGSNEELEHALELSEQFQEDPASFPAEELRERVVPPWVLDQVDATDDWLRSLQTKPNLWLRVKRGQGTALVKKLGNAEVRGLPDAVLYEGEEDLFRTPDFHAGAFELQDLSSQAVGWICAPKPGETWWDACAGEGGKLLHLSDLMENKGLIWASDRAAWRLQKLKRRTARAQAFNYRAAPWDGGAKLPTKTKFDGVLLDAPCSGVGTWQRNPHARWTTTLEDAKELGAIQQKLLAHAAVSLKPGGKLIYSVCTLTKAETTEVADAFANQFKDFQPLPLVNPLDPESTPAERTWIWPQDAGGNGMFVAAWERRHPAGETR